MATDLILSRNPTGRLDHDLSGLSTASHAAWAPFARTPKVRPPRVPPFAGYPAPRSVSYGMDLCRCQALVAELERDPERVPAYYGELESAIR